MRKYIALILLIFAPYQFAEADPVNNLSSFQWQKRILLLNNPANEAETMQSLLKLGPQFAERDLLWFVFSKGNIETNYPGKITSDFNANIKDQYFKGDGEQVVLIGKDGGVKYRAVKYAPTEILRRIDSMPMRQQETKDGSSP
ncbi:DUF4174 domain-containing protein [Microbulbifer sp. MLAF003]|uniref:DUF4174 domain-containing protein n=1 Tax=unclassified Microbulbifer TaxID=2619833 RepID=UPI0024ACA7C6|nr:DUF4174 domain-containing protein [Microbulbifer sp. MLAF003]WHI52857.1 DUF4174 domain-containing protein [Microbulbifer sp. MLAF003]